MGDRGNVVVKDGESKVYLYTHWGRYRLAQDLRNALVRAPDRWDDGQYLARVIFDDMKGDDFETTGYGISSVIGDGDETFVVDTRAMTVNGKSFQEFINSVADEPDDD